MSTIESNIPDTLGFITEDSCALVQIIKGRSNRCFGNTSAINADKSYLRFLWTGDFHENYSKAASNYYWLDCPHYAMYECSKIL